MVTLVQVGCMTPPSAGGPVSYIRGIASTLASSFLSCLLFVLRFLFWAKPCLKCRYVSVFKPQTRKSRDPLGGCSVKPGSQH